MATCKGPIGQPGGECQRFSMVRLGPGPHRSTPQVVAVALVRCFCVVIEFVAISHKLSQRTKDKVLTHSFTQLRNDTNVTVVMDTACDGHVKSGSPLFDSGLFSQ